MEITFTSLCKYYCRSRWSTWSIK